nr:hypothetical protein [Vibrio rotiferianus]
MEADKLFGIPIFKLFAFLQLRFGKFADLRVTYASDTPYLGSAVGVLKLNHDITIPLVIIKPLIYLLLEFRFDFLCHGIEFRIICNNEVREQ